MSKGGCERYEIRSVNFDLHGITSVKFDLCFSSVKVNSKLLVKFLYFLYTISFSC